MEEDKEEDQQEIFEPTFENPTLNSKALLPMNEDVDMMEATAPVSAVTNESISNITEHEENNYVSLHYCQFGFSY